MKHGIQYVNHPKTKINETYIQALKWACQNKPEIPKDPQEEIEENKSYAKKYDEAKNQYVQVFALNNSIEISYIGGQKESFTLEYAVKGFIEQFKNALRKVHMQLI